MQKAFYFDQSRCTGCYALEAKYGDVQKAEGFAYSRKVIPSIVFKPKAGGALLCLNLKR